MREEAVSETMGTVLLVAIAVVLAAGFVVLLFALPPPSPTTHAAIQTYVEPASPDKIVLEHRGGPTIPLGSLAVTLTVDGTSERFVLGQHLGTRWNVTSTSGVVKGASDSFAPGDQAVYVDASLPGKPASVLVADQDVNAVVLGTTALQGPDATAPTLLSAVTTSTTTIRVNFTEPLHALSASDLTLSGLTVSTVRLLGNGSSAEVTTTTAFASSATPNVGSVASPAGTRDFAGNLLAGSAGVTPVDGVAPSITSGPSATGITSTSATIAWSTDESSTSVVGFGPTTLTGRTASDTTPVTSHSVPLGSLTPSTLYFYSVTSRDAAGNVVSSSQGSFTTSAASGGGGGGSSATESNHLDFTSVASVTSGSVSSLYEVTLRAPNNTAVVVASPLTINLATNSTHGHFLDPLGTTVNTSATIAPGQSTAVFRYVDSRPGGRSVLTASASGVISGATTVTVTGRTLQGIPDHLEFTGVPGRLASGVLSTDFTLTLRNSNNQTVRPAQQLDILLLTNSTQGSFVDSLDDTLAITRVSIGTGASSATFRYVDHRPNAVTALVAMANGTTPASTVVEVAGRSGKGIPDHLEFTGVPGSLASGTLSDAFTVTLRDSDNSTVRPASPLVVTLATNSTSGHFVNETTSEIVTRITISPDQTTGRFRYLDARNGGVSVLTATANGTLPAATVVAVGASSGGGSSTPQRLWFTSAPAAINPSMLSGFFVVELRDAGNASIAAASPTTVLLATNGTQGSFHDATTGALLDGVVIPAGGTTATFQYRDNRTSGRSVVTASAAGLADARASVGVHARGLVAAAEDQGAVITRVYYSTEVGDNTNGANLGVSIVNPTNKSFTVARLVLTATNVVMNSDPTQVTGSDAAFADCDTGAGGNQAFTRVAGNLVAICDFADFTLGAYESRQLVVAFNTPNLPSGTQGAFSATVGFASGSPASVTSPSWEYRHSGSNAPGAFALLPRSGGDVVAGLGTSTGLPAGSQTFTFGVASISAATTTTRLVVEFAIPAGWTGLNATSPDSSTVVTLVPPTPTQAGIVRFATSTSFGSGASKLFSFTATPPTMSDTGGFQRVVATMDGAGSQLVAGTYDFYLRFDP